MGPTTETKGSINDFRVSWDALVDLYRQAVQPFFDWLLSAGKELKVPGPTTIIQVVNGDSKQCEEFITILTASLHKEVDEMINEAGDNIIPLRDLDTFAFYDLVKKGLKEDRKSNHTFMTIVAMDGLVPAGICRMTRYYTHSWYDFLPKYVLPQQRLEITDFYVVGAHRETGVGTQMLEAAKDLASRMGVKSLHLSVSPHNQNAMNFYHKNGFNISFHEMAISLETDV